MKPIYFLVLLVLLSFCYSKSDELLQKMYDDIKKDQTIMPSDYYRYIKNVRTKIDTISQIIDASQLSSLEKIGIPRNMAMSLEMAQYTVDHYHLALDTGYSFNPTTNKTSVVIQAGASIIKGDKARFAYFKVTVDADMIRQKDKKVIEHCKKKRKHCWNEIKYEERKTFTQEDSEKINKSMIGRAQADLLTRIKTVMDLSSDSEKFLLDTTSLKFLA